MSGMFPKAPDLNSIGSENYLRLKSGESVKGVFRGQAHLFRQHWGTQSFSTVCKGNGCPECAEGKKSNFRFRINFVVVENGQMQAKVFEQGRKVYTLLNSIHQEADLSKHVVKLARFGSTKEDTQYQVMMLPNGAVSKDLETKLSQVKLHDLAEQPTENPANDFETPEGDEVPF